MSSNDGRSGGDAGPPGSGRAFRLKPFRLLVPYILRYRGRALAALLALIVAALTTLVLPIAVRRMIDLVAVLAVASALRFYLVTVIGEQIVADLRRDVFAHLTSLSPAFFDRAQTGEMMSRLTADTTQIKSAVGASVSIALRNLVLFFGAAIMMVVTSPKLSAFVLGAIPLIVLPLVGFGRAVRHRSRMAQDTL